MSLFAIALLLFSASLHALWNLLLKRSLNKQAFIWWALWCSSLTASPILFIKGFDFPTIAWLCVAGSIVAEFFYFLTLCWGYEIGDLSHVYPLARGSGSLFIALWAFLLLGERPTVTGWLGIGLLIAGVYIVNIASFDDLTRPFRAFRGPVIRLALCTGVAISAYSLIDKVGMRFVHPLVYIDLLFGGVAVVLTPYMFRTVGSATLRAEWRANWPTIIGAALSSMIAYVLILYLLTFTKVSYVGAARSVSVIFGVLLGWLHLREGFGLVRTLAAVLIFGGIACLALAR
ncbi:MAG: EamA family transporter [Candidatus Latescibacteria bacterium]|nr:EamA family transporter [Candidatus Latescibacterota bacterium]